MTTALNDDTAAIDKELILTLCFCSVLALFLVILGLCFKPKVKYKVGENIIGAPKCDFFLCIILLSISHFCFLIIFYSFNFAIAKVIAINTLKISERRN